MLPNTITLPVDVLNNGTTVNKVYTRFDELINQSVYNGPNHSAAARENLNFYRTLNKRVGNSFGVIRTEQKLTRDFSVPAVDGTDVSQPAILRLVSSFPVGLSDAQKLELRQTILALLDNALMVNVHAGEY